MPIVLAVANQKGGVGKTTTALNLASCLAVAEHKTLLIDIDPQGNATSGLGIDKSKLKDTVYQVILGEIELIDIILPGPIPFLGIAAADVDLIGAEIELVNAEGRESRLQGALERLPEGFEYIIIDCPPSLGLLTVNALTAAAGVIIPLQCEFYALEGLSQLMNTIRLIKENFNPRLEIRGILLTMHDSRTNISQQVMEEVRRHFPDLLFETVIPRNVKLSEAPSFGKPILLYDIRSRGAEAYLNFAKEIMSGVKESVR